jgi:hypothetical protein
MNLPHEHLIRHARLSVTINWLNELNKLRCPMSILNISFGICIYLRDESTPNTHEIDFEYFFYFNRT